MIAIKYWRISKISNYIIVHHYIFSEEGYLSLNICSKPVRSLCQRRPWHWRDLLWSLASPRMQSENFLPKGSEMLSVGAIPVSFITAQIVLCRRCRPAFLWRKSLFASGYCDPPSRDKSRAPRGKFTGSSSVKWRDSMCFWFEDSQGLQNVEIKRKLSPLRISSRENNRHS